MNLSIIVPIYNVKDFIIDCLNSIYSKNSLLDFEVICVDDCGKDNSIELINKYVKKHKINNLRIITHKKNSGLSAARNTGLKNAKGKYICYLDSDDMINAPELNKLVKNALKNDLDIADGNYSEIFETTKNISVGNVSKKGLDSETIYSGEEFFEKISKDFAPMVWQRIYKRKYLLDNELFFCEGLKFEDEEFSPRAIIKAKKIMHFDCCMYIYRRRDDSITTSMTKNNDWVNHYLKIIYSLIDFSKTNISKKCSKHLYNRIGQIVLSLYKNPVAYGSTDDNLKEIIEIVKAKKLYKIPQKSKNISIKMQGFLMKYPKLFFLLYKLRK